MKKRKQSKATVFIGRAARVDRIFIYRPKHNLGLEVSVRSLFRIHPPACKLRAGEGEALYIQIPTSILHEVFEVDMSAVRRPPTERELEQFKTVRKKFCRQSQCFKPIWVRGWCSKHNKERVAKLRAARLAEREVESSGTPR